MSSRTAFVKSLIAGFVLLIMGLFFIDTYGTVPTSQLPTFVETFFGVISYVFMIAGFLFIVGFVGLMSPLFNSVKRKKLYAALGFLVAAFSYLSDSESAGFDLGFISITTDDAGNFTFIFVPIAILFSALCLAAAWREDIKKSSPYRNVTGVIFFLTAVIATGVLSGYVYFFANFWFIFFYGGPM